MVWPRCKSSRTFDGKPGYCSKTCRDAALQGQAQARQIVRLSISGDSKHVPHRSMQSKQKLFGT
eukprot:1919330-Amphidinium_carterae.1